MPIKKVMYTVKQRAVGNNARLQDGTKTDKAIHHVKITSIEVQQPEAEGITSQEGVSRAVAELEEADFPVAEEAVSRVVEAAEEDADKLISSLLFFEVSRRGSL